MGRVTHRPARRGGFVKRISATLFSGRPLVDLILIDAGGGHRASAFALKAIVEAHANPWRMRMVNLRDMLEPVDIIRRITGVEVESFYNGLLKHGVTIGSSAMVRMARLLIRQMHRRMKTQIAAFYDKPTPDLVVSLIPHFNRAIYEGLRAADLGRRRGTTPMLTIMTDIADYPPNFWIERSLDREHHMVCGSAVAIAQATEAGYTSDRVFRTSGMIVRPEFYLPFHHCRSRERQRLGLDPELPTGLAMFGGFGSRRMLTIARQTANAGLKTQLIFICGRNERLRRQLESMQLPFPHHIEGFTRDVPYFMRVADYFVGKPGPGSISEALVSGLPVIVESNAWTMVQERYNTRWIAQNRVGVVLRSFNDIGTGLATLLGDAGDGFRTRVKALDNRALFEIPGNLESLIAPRDFPRPISEGGVAHRPLSA
jgi:Glycosyltransferase family 28 C-terminal domain